MHGDDGLPKKDLLREQRHQGPRRDRARPRPRGERHAAESVPGEQLDNADRREGDRPGAVQQVQVEQNQFEQ